VSRADLVALVEARARDPRDGCVILQALDVMAGVVALDMTPEEIARLGAPAAESVGSGPCSSSSSPDPATAAP